MSDTPLRIRDALALVVDLLSVAGDLLYLVLALLIVLMLVQHLAAAPGAPQPSRASTFGAHIRRRWKSAGGRRREGIRKQASDPATNAATAAMFKLSPPSPAMRRMRARAAQARGDGEWVVVRYPH